MSLIRLVLPKTVRRAFYGLLIGGWLSGTAFFVLSRFVEIENEFGSQKHPWQSPVLALHGAMAFLMLMAIGALWLNHVPSGWRSRRSRKLGIALVSMTAVLAVSGWSLYYVAAEQWRSLVGNIHFAVGALLPLTVIAHVISGRRPR